jgi:hypothetical protein
MQNRIQTCAHRRCLRSVRKRVPNPTGHRRQTECGVRDRRFQAILASLVLSHFCGLACRMFRLARTAGSRFGRKHRDCGICYGFGLEGYRFGVSWCGITNKVLDTHVVFQEPRLTAVSAEASERHIHDLFSARVLKNTRRCVHFYSHSRSLRNVTSNE